MVEQTRASLDGGQLEGNEGYNQGEMTAPELIPRCTAGSSIDRSEEHAWRLSIPAGPSSRYRLAQIDDYTHLPRRAFRWQPPLVLELQARVSAANLPGTWGFGLWNDPFSASLGLGGAARRLPALPNCAWFFHASPANYLSLRDDIPARGFLAAVFSSPRLPLLAMLPAVPLLPLLAVPLSARLLRRLGRRLILEDAAQLEMDATDWHAYRLEWCAQSTRFWVDDDLRFETTLAARGPLGLVVWIDNQYAAYTPGGRLKFGTQENAQEAALEIKAFSVRSPAR